MGKRCFFLVSALLACVLSRAQYVDSALASLQDSPSATALRSHVEYLSSAALEGRKACSEGERDAARYVHSKLDEYGVKPLYEKGEDLFGVVNGTGDTLISRNVAGIIPGYDRELKNHYIVIGARLDNLGVNKMTVDGKECEQIYYGANGNASGLSMLLELARRLQTNSVILRRSVILIAFGSSLNSNTGSWYFLNRSFEFAPNVDAMINLDVLGTGSAGFYAYSSSNQDLNNIVQKLGKTLQPIMPEIVSREPFPSDHRAFYDKEIPSILFTSGLYPEFNSYRDTPSVVNYEYMDRELEYIFNYTLALANGPKPIFNQSRELRRKHSEESRVFPYSECDVPPMFLGSPEPTSFLLRWVYKYLRYPEQAVRDGIQGRVLVDFIIDEKGKMTDVKVLRGVDPLLDDEAVRVVSASPDWKPGKVRGQKVKSEISMYVEFKLEKRK